MKPIIAAAITVATVYVWISTVSTSASIARLVMHWIRGIPLLLLIAPYNSDKPSLFWRIYGGFEDSAAYIALSLAKFSRKGDIEKMLVIPDTRAELDKALTTVGVPETKEVIENIQQKMDDEAEADKKEEDKS